MDVAVKRNTSVNVEAWLREDDPLALEELYAVARETRAASVGDHVHLRGLVDFSNMCDRQCIYCGIRVGNSKVTRYMMSPTQILTCAARAIENGYGTLVLQSGEDRRISARMVAAVVAAVRHRFDLTITLSLGERKPDEYRLWRRSGAGRYLLKIETGDPALYGRIHPPAAAGEVHRLEHLHLLRLLGYEIGSGIMVGLPGQTYPGLADDLFLFQNLDPDMIAIGPYIPHKETPLGRQFGRYSAGIIDQVPNSTAMTCKVLALARLLCPEANIPATSALGSTSDDGYFCGLQAGANVIMPNLTPPEFESLYDIYPRSRTLHPKDLHAKIIDDIARAGLTPGTGPGNRCRREN